MVLDEPDLVGQRRTLWLPASDDVDMLRKGRIDRQRGEAERRLKDRDLAWIDALIAEGAVRTAFNAGFFSGGDSREPELAGILGAVVGSVLTLAVTLALAFPLGVFTAVYLEAFAPKNRWTDLIEVNINNLAAVPSIVFGLLGLAVFLNVLSPAALGAHRRRPDARADDAADHHHRRPRRHRRGAALDPRGCAGGRRLAHAGGLPPRPCRWRCPAFSPARSSAWRGRWARPHRC